MKKKTEIVKRTINIADANIHVRENADGKPSRTITGYAIVFGVESEPLWSDEESVAREVIDPTAITRDLLDQSDIKFTMFHDRQLILARSNQGKGTLSYNVDSKGVSFSFDSPNTVDGDKALELVRRGDISGCSFAFATYYGDPDFVERDSAVVDGVDMITYHVKAITNIYDMTLAADPAYTDTTVSTEERELVSHLREGLKLRKDSTDVKEVAEREKKIKEQVAGMRKVANKNIQFKF